MLNIVSVSKIYPGNVTALQDINLHLPKGMFGLLGPNGAGKSTLMRILSTLQEPDAGSISFGGINVIKEKNELRKLLGYLPQQFGTYPRTSARDMLLHFASLKGIHGRQRNEIVEHLLVKTNLWDIRNRSLDKFSGGMKQRYGIAQALIGDPKLIIVDEPTASLDPLERRRFQNLLMDLGSEVVVILSTHIVDDVEEICPNIAIMGKGNILISGDTKQLIKELDGKLWTVLVKKSQLDKFLQRNNAISTRPRTGAVEVRIIADTAPEGGMTALPTLEDVYFHTLHKNNQLSEIE